MWTRQADDVDNDDDDDDQAMMIVDDVMLLQFIIIIFPMFPQGYINQGSFFLEWLVFVDGFICERGAKKSVCIKSLDSVLLLSLFMLVIL